MNLSLKSKIIIVCAPLILAFALGRYTAPSVPNSTIDTKTETNKKTDTDTHKVTVITKDPKTGSETTTITEDTKTNTKTNTDTQIDKTVTAPKTSVINISALAGLDTGRGFVPTYGISANKELIGPITVGAFGLTNGTIGVSLGINF